MSKSLSSDYSTVKCVPSNIWDIEIAMIPLRISASAGREGVGKVSGLIEYSLCQLDGCTVRRSTFYYTAPNSMPAMFSEAPCCS
jgi:hypothetical protein